MNKKNKNAFSIIEILVGIFVFSLGIASVYAIISSTLRINDYNENYIIATNLARGQIELVRNIRDSNYSEIKPYNLKNPSGDIFLEEDKFEFGKYYKIENNYLPPVDFPIKVEEILDFGEGVSELSGKMRDYNLCIDAENRYVYCTGIGSETKTKFYKYISIEEVKDNEGIIENSFLVTSKVIWYIKGYHEFEVKSIIADWKRL